MRGGKTPVHIMRFAPADFVTDKWVRLALSQNEPDLIAFYALFLFHSYLDGGTLPADRRHLAAVLSLRWQVVQRGLDYWSDPACGLIVVRNGLAWNPRVLRDVAKAIEFVETQANHGRHGGRGNRKGSQKGSLSDTENQPLPLPVPKPEPEAGAFPPDRTVRPPNPLVHRDKLLMEGYAAIRAIAELCPDDPTEILARNSVPKDRPHSLRPAVRLEDLQDDRLARTVRDLKAELAERKLPANPDVKHGLPTKMPWEKAAERAAQQEGKTPSGRGSN